MTSNKGRLVWLPEGKMVIDREVIDQCCIAIMKLHPEKARFKLECALEAPELPQFEWSEEQVEAANQAYFDAIKDPQHIRSNAPQETCPMRKALNAAIRRG